MTYYFIYKTTNTVNNKFYIGKHQTDDLDDGYLGSGVALNHAIKKYGANSFVREILTYASCYDSLNRLECEYVTEDLCNNPQSYNIALGGQGGCIVLKEGHPLYNATRKKITDSLLNIWDQTSERVKQLHKEKRVGMHGKKHSEETKVKMSATGKTVPKPWLNGRTLSENTKIKMNEGKQKSEAYLEAQRIKIKRMQANKKTCEHCGAINLPGNHAKWHGENCKNKE